MYPAGQSQTLLECFIVHQEEPTDLCKLQVV